MVHYTCDGCGRDIAPHERLFQQFSRTILATQHPEPIGPRTRCHDVCTTCDAAVKAWWRARRAAYEEGGGDAAT